jgi:hypothetical protein
VDACGEEHRVTTFVCVHCHEPIAPEAVKRDAAGQTYHDQCLVEGGQRVAPSRRHGVVITGIDIGFGDLVILLLKIAFAGIPVGIVLGVLWYVVAIFLH